MRIQEITNNNKTAALYETIDYELRCLVQQQITEPINNLTITVAPKLKAWAIEVLHALHKGADSDKVSMRTLKAIINDPHRFAAQLITHAASQTSGK